MSLLLLLDYLSFEVRASVGLDQFLQVNVVDSQSELFDAFSKVDMHRHNAQQIILHVLLVCHKVEVKVDVWFLLLLNWLGITLLDVPGAPLFLGNGILACAAFYLQDSQHSLKRFVY